MAYRTDQWNRLNLAGEDLGIYGTSSPDARSGGYAVKGAKNDPFKYPSRQVRYVNNQNERQTVDLKRGYIRNITAPENKMGIPTTKCQFQFNPQYLVQSVSQNTSILNFLQQEPGQYAQPIPGNVSFNFDLFFDRSMELNSATDIGVQDGLTPALNVGDPWTSSPSHVGVLHDIAAFYEVIGVGLSDKMGKFAQESLEARITAEINEQTVADDDGGTTVDDPKAQLADALEASATFLKYNVGNTAFLLPLPVRVVFSSLYIVEGLVKDVTVTFTKFNAAMVPMQATLNVLFEAKYIGFAKKDTFFTQVLTDYENQELRGPYSLDGSPEEIREAYDAVEADLKRAVMLVCKQKSNSASDDYYYLDHAPGAIREGGPIDYSGLASDTTEFLTGPAFPSLVSNQNAFNFSNEKVENYQLFFKVGFPDTLNGSKLLRLMDKGKNVSIAVSAQADLWRFDATVLIDPTVQGAWQNVASIVNGTNKAIPGKGTPAYTLEERRKGREFFGTLWDYKAASTKPQTITRDDNGNNPRKFDKVHKVWSAVLNDSNVQTEVKDRFRETVESNVFISSTSAMNDFINAGLTSTVSFNSGEGYYDRSIDRTSADSGYLPDKFPEYETDEGSTFRFGIEYELEVSVTIDNLELPVQRLVDFIILPIRGVGNLMDLNSQSDFDSAYYSVKNVELDWASAKDKALEATGDADDGGDQYSSVLGGGSLAADLDTLNEFFEDQDFAF